MKKKFKKILEYTGAVHATTVQDILLCFLIPFTPMFRADADRYFCQWLLIAFKEVHKHWKGQILWALDAMA